MPDNISSMRENQIQQVAIRMVKEPPLMANEPVNSPEAAILVMNDFLSQMDRELFCIVNLQSDLRPINMNIVSVGALNEALVHPREILKSAVLSNASAMMLIHNHPSGSLAPSQEDIVTTDRMVQIGQLMGIPVVDHVIIGRGQEYYSFHERGTLPVVRNQYATNMDQLAFGSKVAELAPKTATIPLPVEGKDINAVMESLEKGLESFLQGDESRYRQYLQVMTKFHTYSLNNTLLIAMQRPNATLCNSYKRWQGLGRQVRAGEKGIKIIAPAPVKQKRTREKLDENQQKVLGANGQPVMEEVEVTLPRFKPATIFAYEQTEGDPLPLLLPKELTASVENYELFMQAIRKVAPVPIRFDEIEGGAKGYYHTVNKEIVIQKGMSEAQTMKTALHETGHSILHDRGLMQHQGIEKDSMTKEVEAESVAFAVCQAFGLDTSDYSFPYIAGWSHSHDIKDVKASLDLIRKTAGQIIDGMTEQLQELMKEQEAQLQVSGKEEVLSGGKPMFGIYQIADGSDGEQYQFFGMDFVKEKGLAVKGSDYELIYTGQLQEGVTLEDIYERFNLHRPEDFTGHSLSVSDVIVINRGDEAQAYYVDSFGFAPLPDFIQQRSEMTLPEPEIDMAAKGETEELQGNISFYVAECLEFPVMGEYHEDLTLDEAIQAYDSITGDRMHTIKGIGFDLQDGSEYSGRFDLMSGTRILTDDINAVAHYRESPLVQKAISDLQNKLKERAQSRKKAEIGNSDHGSERKGYHGQERAGQKEARMPKRREVTSL